MFTLFYNWKLLVNFLASLSFWRISLSVKYSTMNQLWYELKILGSFCCELSVHMNFVLADMFGFCMFCDHLFLYFIWSPLKIHTCMYIFCTVSAPSGCLKWLNDAFMTFVLEPKTSAYILFFLRDMHFSKRSIFFYLL